MRLLIAFWLLMGWAWADESSDIDHEPIPTDSVESEDGPADSETDEDLLILEDIDVERARAQLDRRIRDLGYKEGDIKDDRVIYRPESAWKPSIVIHDEAFVVIRRTPPRFEPWIGPGAPIRYLSCIPPFTPMCLKLSGVLVSKRRLQHQKTKVTEGIEPMVYEWREAIVDRAMQFRVNEELPRILDDVWLRGIPLDPSLPTLNEPAKRRSEMLDLWASRTCTPEGEAVRSVVQNYLYWEVQNSEHPLTAEEVAQANERCRCDVRLSWPFERADSNP